MFFLQPVTKHAQSIAKHFNASASLSKKIAYAALFGTIAALFQAAGGLIPIAGLFISPFSTAPIILITVLTARYGFLSYLLTIALLMVIQPSEVIVFPFTTGLLGLGIGVAFHLWHRRLSVILFGAGALFLGILFLLIGIQFPVLGPSIHPNFQVLLPIALFSLIYSWGWVELTVFLIKRLFSHHSPNDSGL